MLTHQFDRESVIVALGGGVIGDLGDSSLPAIKGESESFKYQQLCLLKLIHL